MYRRSVVQYRVLGLPIYETAEEDHSLLDLIARDLGAPCPHPRYGRLHQYRWWGLCYLTLPIGEAIETSVSGPRKWTYDEQKKRKVRKMAEDDPALGKEFRQRVIFDNDWEYLHEFIDILFRNEDVCVQSAPADL